MLARKTPDGALAIVRMHEPDVRRAAEALLILLAVPDGAKTETDERWAVEPGSTQPTARGEGQPEGRTQADCTTGAPRVGDAR